MMHSLVEKYRKGMITDHQLAVESVHMLDPQNPGLVLESLPESILRQILLFASDYRRDRMTTNYGVIPTQDQVAAASDWIMHSQKRVTDKIA